MTDFWGGLASGIGQGVDIGNSLEDAKNKRDKNKRDQETHDLKTKAEKAAQARMGAAAKWSGGGKSAIEAAQVYNAYFDDGKNAVPITDPDTGVVTFYEGSFDEKGNPVKSGDAPLMQFANLEQMQGRVGDMINDGEVWMKQQLVDQRTNSDKELIAARGLEERKSQKQRLKHATSEKFKDREHDAGEKRKSRNQQVKMLGLGSDANQDDYSHKTDEDIRKGLALGVDVKNKNAHKSKTADDYSVSDEEGNRIPISKAKNSQLNSKVGDWNKLGVDTTIDHVYRLDEIKKDKGFRAYLDAAAGGNKEAEAKVRMYLKKLRLGQFGDDMVELKELL